ncbi:phospholipase D family protein [Psychrobacter sp. SWN149]|uniref:phospholipase D family protein n=1 Tax=Psychrobacter sp. SWN149 TaxID=2792057 RepID=UPI0018CEA2C3|nr:phospholipase D family protein [Psychrobacter sp. SWN149]MBH0006923.1 phospholipase D family protein [Psychrobacter sp. SWN149]
MSLFSLESSHLSLSLTLGLTLALSACQSLPKQPHLPESQALSERVHELYQNDNSETIQTDLVSAISAQSDIHPDLSGYHPIVTGANAFAARSILTDMATRNIDAQYYIWHNDQAGQLLLKDLWDAAERGVIVRLLLDDFNNSAKFDQHLLRFASHPNIAVRIINPLMHRKIPTLNYVTGLPRINRRMHNKSMTFDKQITIIGGRNIGNEYLSNDQSSQFADLDVLLIGKVVADIDNSFDSYWSSSLSFDIETLAKVDKDVTLNFPAALDKLGLDEENNEGSSLTVYKAAIKDSTIDSDLINKRVPFRWTDMQFLSDDVGKLSKSVPTDSNLVHQLRTLLGSPTKKLTIISSYFVPTKDGVDTLVKLAESGVDIKILTNSFDATDVTAVHSGYSQWRPNLLRSGVKIYELKSTAAEEKRDNKLWRARSQSSTSLHAKTFAVDDYQVFIGSYNVDPRSANINTEMGVIINDDELAKQLHGALSDDLLNQAYEVKLLDNGSLQWHTMENDKEVVYDSEPKVGISDHVWLTIMSWLPIDWLL